ncbi:hypothetical protein HGI30_11760 [Paenibacillus albicereus]|uniref:Uncharacterized protein n=1 Tax=Paenibacillus albicereus TaxID=2726185 RepID=A0A6H2GXK7_9BACL|nr:hypothetical protein [Paenibacillus albicereus]QJC52164.1 hypothetical protein HGI30_11760 [Paenibacillus albicereus]
MNSMNPNGQQPQGDSSLTMTYEQFQEQQRQRRDQEMVEGRQALLRAGADSSSEKVRGLINTMQELVQELSMTENQIQVQADAQLRQLRKLKERASSVEAEVRSSLGGSALH